MRTEEKEAVLKYIRLESKIRLAWLAYHGTLSFGEFALTELAKEER